MMTAWIFAVVAALLLGQSLIPLGLIGALGSKFAAAGAGAAGAGLGAAAAKGAAGAAGGNFISRLFGRDEEPEQPSQFRSAMLPPYDAFANKPPIRILRPRRPMALDMMGIDPRYLEAIGRGF